MTMHSPGPWRIEIGEPGEWSRLIHGQDFDEIASMRGDHPWPEQDANARLIAAAPELLAACKALQMEAASRGFGLRIADEAIAKAEGKSL